MTSPRTASSDAGTDVNLDARTDARGDVKPFPFAALEPLTRRDAATTARLRRIAREQVDVNALARAAAELAGEPVTIAMTRQRRMAAPRAADDSIGVVLALANASPSEASKRVVIELEGALGASLVSRALRQKAPRIVDNARATSPALAGALAAVVLAIVRRAHAGVPAKVIAAGPGGQLARDLFASERDVTTVWLTVTVGADAFEARVSVPDALVPAPDPEADRLSQDALARMRDARIALPLVAMTTLAARSDLASLARGDVFVPVPMPAPMPMTRALLAREDGALEGSVALVPPRAERGLAVDLAAGGQLVVRGLVERHAWAWARDRGDTERAMPPDPSATATLEVLEEAPVVVRVELGTVEMTAREWAALGAGDVVALGRKLGDPAILRVGGVELAQGELVQVDGEYGVRILARPRSSSEG